MKITDPDYRLPRLDAKQYECTLETGANKPAIITARDQLTKQATSCVAKFMGGERMRPESCTYELLAAFIAKQWGIRVVEPVLINVSKDFVELERDKPHHGLLSKSIGLNVGSIYVPGFVTIPVHQPLTEVELPYAQQILLYDILIQNPDRRVDKPNLMSNGKELIVCDHELAFSFLYSFSPSLTPYQLTESDRPWIENFFLLSKIKRFPLPESSIIAAISSLDDTFWNCAFELIPPEWRTSQLPEIRSFLKKIVNNAEAFVQSVKPFLV